MKKKKLMSLFVLGCGVLLLVGCGDEKKEEKKSTTETIKCTVKEEESGMVTTATTKFVYDKKDKALVSGSMDMSMDYSDSLKDMEGDEKEQAESLIESMLGGMCDSFKDEGYKNCKSTFNNAKFNMTMDFDMDKIEDTTDGDINVDMTLEELKDYFEETDGTKCTIE